MSDTNVQSVHNWTEPQNLLLDWLANPTSLREPKAIVDLAEKLGFSRRTLDRWMDKPGFDEERAKRIRKQFIPDTPNVLAALKRKALGDADNAPETNAIKVWMEHIENVISEEQQQNAIAAFYGAILNHNRPDQRSESAGDAQVSPPPEADGGSSEQSEIPGSDSGAEVREESTGSVPGDKDAAPAEKEGLDSGADERLDGESVEGSPKLGDAGDQASG